MKNYLVKPGSRLIIEILLSLVSLLQSVLISLEQNCLKVFILNQILLWCKDKWISFLFIFHSNDEKKIIREFKISYNFF